MSKYSFEFKQKLVLEYLSGNFGGFLYLAEQYNLSNRSLLQDWVNRYEQYGEEGLKKKMTKAYYSGEFKLSVIQYRQLNQCSYKEAANHFEIENLSMIANWDKKYLEEGFEGLDRSIGRPNNMHKDDENKNLKKSKELSKSENDELIKLREENEFLRASLAYEKKLKALIQNNELTIRKNQK